MNHEFGGFGWVEGNFLGVEFKRFVVGEVQDEGYVVRGDFAEGEGVDDVVDFVGGGVEEPREEDV